MAKVNQQPVREDVLKFLIDFNLPTLIFSVCVPMYMDIVCIQKMQRKRMSLKQHEASLNKTRITVYLEPLLAKYC